MPALTAPQLRPAIHELFRTIEAAVGHYEKTAPTLADWLDGLYRRLGSTGDDVRVSELLFVNDLFVDDDWAHPNYAANRLYHLQERLGQSTTGHAGF